MDHQEPTPQEQTRPTTLWTIVKIILALVLLGVVFRQTNIHEFQALLQRISIPLVLISFLLFFLLTWLSARRYWILLGKQIKFPRIIRLRILQNVVSNFVASSAGAATYIAVLRGEHGLQIRTGFVSFILAIIGDLFVIGFCLILSTWATWDLIVSLRWLIVILVSAIIFGILLFVFTVYFRQHFVKGISVFLQRLSLDNFSLIRKAIELLNAMAIQNLEKLISRLKPLVGYSILIMCTTILRAYVSVRAFGMPIELKYLAFIAPLNQLLSLVPIQVFGGLGVTEITQFYLYDLFVGTEFDVAPVVIGMRVLFYIFNLLLLSYLPLGALIDRKSAPESDPDVPIQEE